MALQFAPYLLLVGISALLFRKRTGLECPKGTSGGVLDGIKYKEIVTGGAGVNDELPMIIVFHGLQSSPENMIPKMSVFKEKARIILPEGIHEDNGHHYWWEKRAKDPDQNALARQIESTSIDIAPFLRGIPKCRPTIGKPYVAGHSQGAMMSYAIATIFKNDIKAAFPASGWLPEDLWSPNTAPIYAVHGRGDTTIPFGPTADYVAKMHQLGAQQIFLREAKGGHPLTGELLWRWHDIMKRELRK